MNATTSTAWHPCGSGQPASRKGLLPSKQYLIFRPSSPNVGAGIVDGNGAQSEENRRSSAWENPQQTMKEVDIERRYARVEVSIAHHRFCFGRLVLYVIVGAISFVCNSSYALHYKGDYELSQKTTMSLQRGENFRSGLL